MTRDLQIIKKKYGENMSRLCREFFSSILETEGLLSNLMLTQFEPSHQLYNDIVDNNLISGFKNFIYSLVDIEATDSFDSDKTPQELLDEAGYILYECKTENDIQNFKGFYAEGEELCTFLGGRLDRCRVFFAVKKDVNSIRREMFSDPERQDLYGTSVISIQFTKDGTNTLSIKNRYNHRVKNPDATFSNNLDNIIPGLTKAFENEYGIVQQNGNNKFEIPGYVRANDGKYYKYNYEIINIYYCPNNVIIDNFEVKRFDKEKYIVLDYFILDLQNKKIVEYNRFVEDSFANSIGEIEKIEIVNLGEEKEINIIPKEGKVIKITLDRENRIVKLINDNVKEIGKDFLYFNTALEELRLGAVEIIGSNFLYRNNYLKSFFAPNLRKVDVCFLQNNLGLKELELESLNEAGNYFLWRNINLTKFRAPNLKKIKSCCLCNNKGLTELKLESLEEVENSFLYWNDSLIKFCAPKLQKIGENFLYSNTTLIELYAPKLNKKGNNFLCLSSRSKLIKR